jgi:hypothetical protein
MLMATVLAAGIRPLQAIPNAKEFIDSGDSQAGSGLNAIQKLKEVIDSSPFTSTWFPILLIILMFLLTISCIVGIILYVRHHRIRNNEAIL